MGLSMNPMLFFQEALLEPVARKLRFAKGATHLGEKKSSVLVDLGCGPNLRFLRYLLQNSLKIKKYIGIDPLINKQILKSFEQNSIEVEIVKKPVIKKIPLKDKTADVIVAFAFFEHIHYPKEIIRDCMRVLKPGGKLIITAPSYKAKSVLEFLSFKLGLISRREINEHKQYFDENSLLKLLPKNKNFKSALHQYFELGLNNLLVVTK